MDALTVVLELEEWHRVLAILATAPWSQANPLIMKIGEQLRQHAPQMGQERRPDGADRAGTPKTQ